MAHIGLTEVITNSKKQTRKSFISMLINHSSLNLNICSIALFYNDFIALHFFFKKYLGKKECNELHKQCAGDTLYLIKTNNLNSPFSKEVQENFQYLLSVTKN